MVLLPATVLVGLVQTLLSPTEFVVREGFVQANRTGWAALGLPLVVATYVVALVWVFRAASNARQLSGKPSPGWAVGSWFLPVAHIVLPVFPMVETAKATRAGGTATAWGVGWAVYMLVAYVVAIWSAVFGMMKGAELARSETTVITMPASLVAATWVGQALAVTAGALFLALVWKVTQAQERSRAQPNQAAGL